MVDCFSGSACYSCIRDRLCLTRGPLLGREAWQNCHPVTRTEDHKTHVANIHNFLIKGVSSCSSPPGLAPSGIERPEWVAVPAPYVTVRWPVVGDVCARQSMRSTCFQIRGAANVRHAFEVRLSSQRSSRDRRAKMAATNSLGRSRRGDVIIAGYRHKSRYRRPARDRGAFFSTGLRYLANVSNTRGVDVSMMWRGPKPQQATGSNNHQGAREAAITDGGCAVLYASSTFHKCTCMQANNTCRNNPNRAFNTASPKVCTDHRDRCTI